MLERIAYTEVDAYTIGTGKVVIRIDGFRRIRFPVLAILICLERRMDGHTDIEANNKSVQVEAQTGTCAECDLLGQIRIIHDTVV